MHAVVCSKAFRAGRWPWLARVASCYASVGSADGFGAAYRREMGETMSMILRGLLLIGLLTVGEWWFLLGYSRLPTYAGPVLAEQPFPDFAPASLADGTPFTRDNLIGEKDTVLVFFRGFW